MYFTNNLIVVVATLLSTASAAPDASPLEARALNTNLQKTFPSLTGTTLLAAATTVSGSFDGEMKLWDHKTSTYSEQAKGGDVDAVFLLKDIATLSNVVIGPKKGEGVDYLGSYTLNNLWCQDVYEDAATFKQKSGTSYIHGGGAKDASDMVFQHNGGRTVAVKNFYFYRSCRNCETQYKRTSSFTNEYVKSGKLVAGVTSNYGDKTTIEDLCVLPLRPLLISSKVMMMVMSQRS